MTPSCCNFFLLEFNTLWQMVFLLGARFGVQTKSNWRLDFLNQVKNNIFVKYFSVNL